MVFRVQSRYLFLTYPRCDAPKMRLLDALQRVLSLRMAWCIIAQECHQEEGFHLHCVIGFHKKFDCKNERLFDFDGFHPNIQSVRDLQQSIRYVQKEDTEPLVFGDLPKPKRSWQEVLSARDRASAEETIQQIAPRDYVLNHERIEYYLNKKFAPVIPPYVNSYNFTDIPHALQVWSEQRLLPDRPKSLILWGPTRLGKTAWARSLGRHIYFNGLFMLDLLDSDAEYVIFDDFDWEHFKQYKQWLGAQKEFIVTDKYRRKQLFKWGKPTILLSNVLPNFPDMSWVRSNCIILQINSSLFYFFLFLLLTLTGLTNQP